MGVAILDRLDDLAAHGGVVHVDATVDLRQIGAALGSMMKGVEGADQVAPVDADVAKWIRVPAGTQT